MTANLSVLLIESDVRVGDTDACAVEAAGHTVQRCYPAAERGAAAGGSPSDDALCTGVTSGTCPLDTGVDVALLVRPQLATKPAWREAGVSCALRAGVPVVEDGPDLLDPYEPWISGRVGGDVVASCETAARGAEGAIVREVVRRTDPVLRGAGIDPASVTCRVVPRWPDVRVVFEGPPVPASLQQALSVRALDAVHATPRRFRGIDVSYETTA
jgi:hypothetical protein